MRGATSPRESAGLGCRAQLRQPVRAAWATATADRRWHPAQLVPDGGSGAPTAAASGNARQLRWAFIPL